VSKKAKRQSRTPAKKAAKNRVDPWGIETEYTDAWGVSQVTSPETRRALLKAMGAEGESPPPSEPAVVVIRYGQSVRAAKSAELTLEDGTALKVKGKLPPDLPLGYHELRNPDSPPARLIVTPAHCPLAENYRTWGWAVQVYALRSAGSWGMGDLSDLRELGHWSSQLGAGIVLINPLHAVTPVVPQQASPYFPSSRRFHNPLYLNIEEVPGAGALGRKLEKLAAAGRALNHGKLIDRDAVFKLKMEAQELLWARRVESPAFESFRKQQGEALNSFATFCALAERLGGDWRSWQAKYRHPNSPAVRRLAKEHADRIVFFQWLQWLLDEQLARAAAALPLVQDLPIGVDPGGADAWQWQDVLASGATVGAPPDEFNTLGQDWSLPPFVPHRLRAVGYQPFIETIRASLRHAGGLRIDHVMGLFRLYWIPQGLGPRCGAYVRYPADDLLGIVALESHRAGAWVAGEDLGTVEKSVQDQMARHKMLSYRLLWFEEDPPDTYPELALAAVTTHDLPTIAGLWSGSDMAAQHRLNLNPNEAGYHEMRERLSTMAKLKSHATAEQAILAAHRLLGQAPSAILAPNLTDALAVEERPNMPGTSDQWPNWCIPLPVPLEELKKSPLAHAIATALRRA
jgi:4-alpha-glucanotransferase